MASDSSLHVHLPPAHAAAWRRFLNNGAPMAEAPDILSGKDRLLTPGQVAALFRVDPKTVTRWAAAGRIGCVRTPGNQRRFRESEIRALLQGEPKREAAG